MKEEALKITNYLTICILSNYCVNTSRFEAHTFYLPLLGRPLCPLHPFLLEFVHKTFPKANFAKVYKVGWSI